MDAYLGGDAEEVERLKDQIAAQEQARFDRAYPKTVQINNVLNDAKAPSIKLYDFVEKALGKDWWELEIETVERLLWVKYQIALDDVNRDRIMALRHLCRSDGAFSDWFEFNQFALSAGRAIADFESVRIPSPGMIIAAVKTMNHIRPDRGGEFSNDVLKYICITLIEQGIYIPPPSLVLLVKDHMQKMVSEETRKEWVAILNRFGEFDTDPKREVRDDLVDTQAKRILTAEYAADAYCGV